MSKQWQNTRLADVLNPAAREEIVDSAKEYRLLGVRLDGHGPFLRETVIGTQISATKLSRVAAGDFIYSRLFACRGAFGVISEELDGCCVSGEFPTFLPVPRKVDVEFLKYWFRLPSVITRINEDCSGSTPLTRNRFKENFFLALEIPLPPLAEQRRIVARIEEVAPHIDEARQLRREAAEEAEALIVSALTHLQLPSGSVTKPIAECSSMSTGTTPPSDRLDYYGGPIQWYTPGDLEFQQQLGPSSRTLSEVALAERKARIFEPGTVLLVAIGGSLGKVALTHERCSANQQITGIKFSNYVLPEYGFWWMRRLGKELKAAAPQATLPIINQERIGTFEISIPPLQEQRRIVAELNNLQAVVDELKQVQAESSAVLDLLFPSILYGAFKGELYT